MILVLANRKEPHYNYIVVCFEVVRSISKDIEVGELQCEAMADNLQRTLNEALSALEEATKVDLCLVNC